jgi:hypothetical protein
MTFSITPLNLKGLFVPLSITKLWHFSECHYAECRVLLIVKLNVVMLSVIMLNVVVPYQMPIIFYRCPLEDSSIMIYTHLGSNLPRIILGGSEKSTSLK